jgi:hypothetical protein
MGLAVRQQFDALNEAHQLQIIKLNELNLSLQNQLAILVAANNHRYNQTIEKQQRMIDLCNELREFCSEAIEISLNKQPYNTADEEIRDLQKSNNRIRFLFLAHLGNNIPRQVNHDIFESSLENSDFALFFLEKKWKLYG